MSVCIQRAALGLLLLTLVLASVPGGPSQEGNRKAFTTRLALAPGPGPDPQAASREALRLDAWPSSCGRPQAAASELAVVPPATPGSPTSNARPVRPRDTRRRHIPRPTSLRALDRVPSSAAARADFPAPRPPASSGFAIPLKTGSEFPLGPTRKQKRHLCSVSCLRSVEQTLML
jgi:hypothetical protein